MQAAPFDLLPHPCQAFQAECWVTHGPELAARVLTMMQCKLGVCSHHTFLFPLILEFQQNEASPSSAEAGTKTRRAI